MKLCWHIDDQEPFLAADHTHLREILHPEKSEWKDLPFSLAHARLEAGEKSLPHRLKSKELYYFLEGRGQITIAGQSFAVRPGSLVMVPAQAEQWVENTGDSALIFLCLVTPPWRAEEDERVR